MALAHSSVNDNTANGLDTVSTSVILHLVHGDIVDLGWCSAVATLNDYSKTSLSGFLLQED